MAPGFRLPANEQEYLKDHALEICMFLSVKLRYLSLFGLACYKITLRSIDDVVLSEVDLAIIISLSTVAGSKQRRHPPFQKCAHFRCYKNFTRRVISRERNNTKGTIEVFKYFWIPRVNPTPRQLPNPLEQRLQVVDIYLQQEEMPST